MRERVWHFFEEDIAELLSLSHTHAHTHTHTHTHTQMLADMCGLSGDAADEVARSLQSYAACKPAKLHTHVVRTLSLSDLLHCFDLPAKVGRGELHVSEVQEQEGVAGRDQEGVATEAGHEELSAGRVLLVLKRGIDKQSLSDLGG